MSDKAQPTPGPWRTERRIHSVSVMAEKRLLVVSTSWHSFERDCYPLQDEAEANARLIAAAPDMLEALRLHDVYMDTPQDRGGAFGAKAQARAAFDDAKRAAIAKATGA